MEFSSFSGPATSVAIDLCSESEYYASDPSRCGKARHGPPAAGLRRDSDHRAVTFTMTRARRR